MTKEQLWKETLDFYKECVAKYKMPQELMISIVQHFDNIGLNKKYFPSTSHESLGLSTVEKYEERLVKPMVYITYQPKRKTFLLTFQRGQGKTVHEEDCGVAINKATIIRIEEWLSDAN